MQWRIQGGFGGLLETPQNVEEIDIVYQDKILSLEIPFHILDPP